LIAHTSIDSVAIRENSALRKKPDAPPQLDASAGKLIHLAMPVRWSLVGQEGRAAQQMACTYDVHARGARLLSSRPVNAGDLVLIERGRNKAVCRVIWTADPESPLRGQFTVECVDSKAPWDEECRQVEEQFLPVNLDPAPLNSPARDFSRPDVNRRRRPRFYVEGEAEVIDGVRRVAAEIEEMSEFGVRLLGNSHLLPGHDFRLMLNVFDVNVSLRAQVKYLSKGHCMGVEFQEIRRGDRPLLSYLLSRVGTRRVEQFAEVEVVAEPRAAAAK
jgi:hypothetical protein